MPLEGDILTLDCYSVETIGIYRILLAGSSCSGRFRGSPNELTVVIAKADSFNLWARLAYYCYDKLVG